MYAIIETGSKQFKVQEKDVIAIEKISHKPGKEFNLGKVLLVKDGRNIHIGQPQVKDFKVHAKVLKDIKDKKRVSYRYIRREDSKWKKGHRQNLSLVEITKISSDKKESNSRSNSNKK